MYKICLDFSQQTHTYIQGSAGSDSGLMKKVSKKNEKQEETKHGQINTSTPPTMDLGDCDVGTVRYGGGSGGWGAYQAACHPDGLCSLTDGAPALAVANNNRSIISHFPWLAFVLSQDPIHCSSHWQETENEEERGAPFLSDENENMSENAKERPFSANLYFWWLQSVPSFVKWA